MFLLVEIVPRASYRKVAEFSLPAIGWRREKSSEHLQQTLGPCGAACRGCVLFFAEQGEKDMESKPAQNIQDSFLNTARKDKSVITIYLLSGVKLTGRIRSFDKYSVVLETNNQEQLIFKHAISTVVMSRVAHPERHVEPRPMVTASAASDGAPAPVAED